MRNLRTEVFALCEASGLEQRKRCVDMMVWLQDGLFGDHVANRVTASVARDRSCSNIVISKLNGNNVRDSFLPIRVGQWQCIFFRVTLG